MAALPPSHVVIERDAGHGEIAAAAGELLEAVAPRGGPRRQMHLGDDLVGLERGGERALEEIGGLDGARAGLADHRDFRIAGLRNAGHLGRRIGVREAAADGAAVADLVMRDVRDRFLQQRMRGRRAACRRGCRASAPARRGARHPAPILISFRPGNFRKSTSSDGWAMRNAIIGIRLWPPAKRLGLAAVVGEQRDGFIDGGWAGVFEGRKFHGVCFGLRRLLADSASLK